MTATDLERIAAFERRFARAQATEITDFAWGFGLLQHDFPHSYNHNRVVAESAAPATEVLAGTNHILARAGLAHRHVTVADDELGQLWAPEFVAAGYEHVVLVTMIDSAAAPEPPEHEVTAVSLETLRPAVERDWRLQLPHASDEEISQLACRMALYSRGAESTLLAAYDGDQIAGRVEVYIDRTASIGQLENLFIHPDFRGHGYGESLINEARRRIRQAGCELSFLDADQHDWPHVWYGRLGYLAARTTHDFTLIG